VIRWLFRILWGCTRTCEWETIGNGKVLGDDEDSKVPVGLYYVLRCKTCGDIKSRRV
jgi:hypothetical protein